MEIPDVYIHLANGEEANVWASYQIEHPLSSALERVDWIEVLRTANEIADVLGKSKALSDDKPE